MCDTRVMGIVSAQRVGSLCVVADPVCDSYVDRSGVAHTISYDPDLAHVRRGDAGHEIVHPGGLWPQIIMNSPPGLLWRGMCDAEYRQAVERGYFQSDGHVAWAGWGQGLQGKTFFTTDPVAAASYAVRAAPTFEVACHVVGIPDRPDVPRGERGDDPASHQVAVDGAIFYGQMVAHYVCRAIIMGPDVDTVVWWDHA